MRTRVPELAMTLCMKRAELFASCFATRKVVTTLTAFSGAAATTAAFLTTFSGALAASGLVLVRTVWL